CRNHGVHSWTIPLQVTGVGIPLAGDSHLGNASKLASYILHRDGSANMLRTRLYLGLLPLLLLLIGMGGYSVHTCLELSRSLELTMVAHYRAMLATEAMK